MPTPPTSTWAGSGSLSVGANSYSAVAIGRRYVLTAAHVAKGADPANVKFNLNFGANLSHRFRPQRCSRTLRSSPSTLPTLSTTSPSSSLRRTSPPACRSIRCISPSVAAGTRLVMVGYGATGQGDVGATVGGTPAVKRVGSNNADAFEADADGSGRNALFMFDFDGGSAANFLGGATLGNRVETGLAGGDSGSPSFIFADGQWKVAGINTFIFTFSGGPTATQHLRHRRRRQSAVALSSLDRQHPRAARQRHLYSHAAAMGHRCAGTRPHHRHPPPARSSPPRRLIALAMRPRQCARGRCCPP